MNANVKQGDWVAGFLSKKRDNKLLYAMELTVNPLDMDDYFHNPDFQAKKPNLRGDWMERCGDNFYSKKPDGKWQQHPTLYHSGYDKRNGKLKAWLDIDTEHPVVFVSKTYWYFGQSAKPVPDGLLPLIPGKGMHSKKHPPELVTKFCNWVRRFPPGIHGNPHDNLYLNKGAIQTAIIPLNILI